MEAVLESLAQGFRRFAAIANGWLPRPARVSLAEKDRLRLTGRFQTKDGLYFDVTETDGGFRIDGLMQGELLPIDTVTLYDSADSEALVRFRHLQIEGYADLTITHPLRLTITAQRV